MTEGTISLRELLRKNGLDPGSCRWSGTSALRGGQAASGQSDTGDGRASRQPSCSARGRDS
jgi:hypothetical protein